MEWLYTHSNDLFLKRDKHKGLLHVGDKQQVMPEWLKIGS